SSFISPLRVVLIRATFVYLYFYPRVFAIPKPMAPILFSIRTLNLEPVFFPIQIIHNFMVSLKRSTIAETTATITKKARN
ncbi:MAG: hypothetical protein PVF55_09990, partial [Desulfobacterales bacterium]